MQNDRTAPNIAPITMAYLKSPFWTNFFVSSSSSYGIKYALEGVIAKAVATIAPSSNKFVFILIGDTDFLDFS